MAEQCANITKTIEAAQKRGASNEEVLRLVKPCQTLGKNVLSEEIDSKALTPTGVSGAPGRSRRPIATPQNPPGTARSRAESGRGGPGR